jgi:hypothetical protein
VYGRGLAEAITMQPTAELIDAIYREKVLRARRVPIEQKFRAGAELFEMVCRRMADGLRSENPGADEARIGQLLGERLDRLRRLRAADDRR